MRAAVLKWTVALVALASLGGLAVRRRLEPAASQPGQTGSRLVSANFLVTSWCSESVDLFIVTVERGGPIFEFDQHCGYEDFHDEAKRASLNKRLDRHPITFAGALELTVLYSALPTEAKKSLTAAPDLEAALLAAETPLTLAAVHIALERVAALDRWSWAMRDNINGREQGDHFCDRIAVFSGISEPRRAAAALVEATAHGLPGSSSLSTNTNTTSFLARVERDCVTR